MRILFIGSKKMAICALSLLLEHEAEICAVIARPDDPHPGMWFPSLTEFARGQDLLTLQPKNINDSEFVDQVRALRPDRTLTVFFPSIYKADFLSIAKRGNFNLHFAPLPRYRGCFPGAWAIINNEKQHGVTVHHIALGVDSGDIAFQKMVDIDSLETGVSLYEKCEEAGKALIRSHIDVLLSGDPSANPQSEENALYYPRGTPYGGVINWGWSAEFIERYVRALTFPPFPNPCTFVGPYPLHLDQVRVISKDAVGQVLGRVLSRDPLHVQCGRGIICVEKYSYSPTKRPRKPSLDEVDQLGI